MATFTSGALNAYGDAPNADDPTATTTGRVTGGGLLVADDETSDGGQDSTDSGTTSEPTITTTQNDGRQDGQQQSTQSEPEYSSPMSTTDKELKRQGCKTCGETQDEKVQATTMQALGAQQSTQSTQQSGQRAPAQQRVSLSGQGPVAVGFFPKETKEQLGDLLWWALAALIGFLGFQLL